MVERVDDSLPIADAFSHVRSSRASVTHSATMSGAIHGGQAAVERVSQRGGVAGLPGELDRLPAERVAARARRLVAQRAREAGEEPGPQFDVVLGERREALLAAAARARRRPRPAPT